MTLVETTCLNIGCPSVVPDAYGPGQHYHHVMLIDGPSPSAEDIALAQATGAPSSALYPCPVCGELTASPAEGSLPPTQGARFPLGKRMLTPGVQRLLEDEVRPGLRMVSAEKTIRLNILVDRHQRGEWPGCGVEDCAINNEAIKPDVSALNGGWKAAEMPFVLARRQVRSFPDFEGAKVWIVTEAGRHATELLLPEEA